MRILIVTHLYPGHEKQGPQDRSYAVHYFAKVWKELGHDVHVIRPWISYPKVFNVSKRSRQANDYKNDCSFLLDEVTIHRLYIKKVPKVPFTSQCYKRFSFKIQRKLSEFNFKPDLILSHMIEPNLFVSSQLAVYYNCPYYSTLHSTDLRNLSTNKRIKKNFEKLLPSIAGIGFRNKGLLDWFKKIFHIKKPLYVVESGIELDYLLSVDDLTKKAQKQSKRIFTAASMIPIKNIGTVIDAFEGLDNDNIELIIAGEGPLMKTLQTKANNSLKAYAIDFLGEISREEVLNEMREADIFVLVSEKETFGLVYLEAMASGCLTIGSKGEGIDGVIQSGDNGYLVSAGDKEALIEAFETALNLSTKDKERLLLNALQTASNMTKEKVAEQYFKNIT